MSELSKSELRQLYRRRARHYDITANLYYLIGFREFTYRRRAVESLELSKGDSVVEIGCGTGLNFPLLRQAVGDQGTVIGVDLTDAMLTAAKKRIARHGWDNVRVYQSDAAEFEFPREVAGIISTFALSLIPTFDDVIARGACSLRPGGRWVVLDLKKPHERFRWLTPLALRVMQPFGVNPALFDRHPWESLEQHLGNLEMTELYGGFAYIATGQAARSANSSKPGDRLRIHALNQSI